MGVERQDTKGKRQGRKALADLSMHPLLAFSSKSLVK